MTSLQLVLAEMLTGNTGHIMMLLSFVLQALKRDVIRSIIARCELLCEDLLQAEEEQGSCFRLSVIAVWCYASVAYAVMLCFSVCPSVCLSPSRLCILKWECVFEMSKYILQIFSPSGSQAIVFFHTKHCGNRPMGTPNGGVECRWHEHKLQFWMNSWLLIDDCWG